MIEANCNKCNKRRKFNQVKKNKYKCNSCNTIVHKCSGKQCDNMITVGLYCKKCIGKGLKKGGSIAAVGVAAIGVGAIKVLTSGKDNEIER